MYRIRFHGRGGQGIKTASRVLGTALFLEGYEVQDAPRYGAERRGAPIFAYVRAARAPIKERGIIRHPDLVVDVDPSLLSLTAGGVLEGITDKTALLVNGPERPGPQGSQPALAGHVYRLPEPTPEGPGALPHGAVACAGAGARLLGVVTPQTLERAVEEELEAQGAQVVGWNVRAALTAYDALGPHAGAVHESFPSPSRAWARPDWIDVPFEEAPTATPMIRGGGTSVLSQTGLWRTERPVLDPARCHQCWWICTTLCPDNAMTVDEQGRPAIDYDHCKGCMICLSQCPNHAIDSILEQAAEAVPPPSESEGGS